MTMMMKRRKKKKGKHRPTIPLRLKQTAQTQQTVLLLLPTQWIILHLQSTSTQTITQALRQLMIPIQHLSLLLEITQIKHRLRHPRTQRAKIIQATQLNLFLTIKPRQLILQMWIQMYHLHGFQVVRRTLATLTGQFKRTSISIRTWAIQRTIQR